MGLEILLRNELAVIVIQRSDPSNREYTLFDWDMFEEQLSADRHIFIDSEDFQLDDSHTHISRLISHTCHPHSDMILNDDGTPYIDEFGYNVYSVSSLNGDDKDERYDLSMDGSG